MVGGDIYSSRLGSRLGTLRLNFLAGVLATGAGLLTCLAVGSLSGALAPFALIGFGNALIFNPENRLLQELVVDGFRGRILGMRDVLESACFVVAFLGGGAVVSVAGPRSVYLIGGVLLLATGAAGWLAFRPRRTRTERQPLGVEAVPQP
jgi:hypothetical protein